MADLAEFCGITASRDRERLIPPSEDSQDNSGLSRQNLRSYKSDALTESELKEIDQVMSDICELPKCADWPLEGEIMAKILGLT